MAERPRKEPKKKSLVGDVTNHLISGNIQSTRPNSSYEIKDARLNLKIKQSVKEKLYELAKEDGLSATDFIEKIVNKEYNERNT